MKPFLAFLQGLDADLRAGLQAQLRVLWTHHSTAIEGNSLTLVETDFVLGEGLTVAGKPLKDHQQVAGHARAIDILTDWLRQERILTEAELFLLHRAVQTEVIIDIYQPIGAWKQEPNGTQIVMDGKLIFNDAYAYPEDVPTLMADWLALLAGHRGGGLSQDEALSAYAELHATFVRIHPFTDGNGRMARLLANIPVLEAGFPPLVIPRERRQEYLRTLAVWELQVGRPITGSVLLTDNQTLAPFVALCRDAWQTSLELVNEYRQRQATRDRVRKP